MTVESGLQNAYGAYLDAGAEATEEGVVEVPGDFPIRSVAGALYAPVYTSSLLEDYFAELSFATTLELELTTILANLIRSNVPFADLKSIVRAIKITVRFPDGSTQDYEIGFSVNAVTGNAEMELQVYGNPRLENGHPAPTSSLAFNGLTLADNNGSLAEWILWARHLGLIVSGTKGTAMTCSIKGDVIYCKMVKKP
jgi:hypothetical protein